MFARTFKKDNSTKNKSKIDENSRSLDIKLSFLRYIDIKKNIKGNNIKNVKYVIISFKLNLKYSLGKLNFSLILIL